VIITFTMSTDVGDNTKIVNGNSAVNNNNNNNNNNPICKAPECQKTSVALADRNSRAN